MKHYQPHIVFSGGGTLGHLFPGLATAERIADDEPGVRITFAGGGKPLEQRQVIAAGFDYLALPCRPMPRGPREAFGFFTENLAGIFAAKRFINENPVDVVVGLGGYASVPMARAALRYNIPLVLMEQNSVPGKATRWLARRATLICAAMAKTRANLKCRCPIEVTGNPIRGCVLQQSTGWQSASDTRRLLVLGGSGGAESLNENVPRALYKTRSQLAGWEIVHQTGDTGLDSTRSLYRKLGLEAAVVPFIDNLPALMAESGLAISRAGGSTLAELSAAGVPSVLVPYPFATDDHQAVNAEVYTRAGAAVTVDGRHIEGRLDDHLAAAVSELVGSEERRRRMSAAMRRLSHPQASETVAAAVVRIAEVHRQPQNRLVAA